MDLQKRTKIQILSIKNVQITYCTVQTFDIMFEASSDNIMTE